VERTMSRTTGGTLGPVTSVNDTAWIAKLMGDPKGLPEQRVPVCKHRQRNSRARNRMGYVALQFMWRSTPPVAWRRGWAILNAT
jgi:hypothetical protein